MSDREIPPPSAASVKNLFPTTRWTIVRSLNNGERRVRFTAWDEFCRSYQRPLQAWLNTRTRNPQQTEELVQSFLAQLPHKEHAIDALNPSQGKLRAWLLTCLKRHWINTLRLHRPDRADLPDDFPDPTPPSDDLYDREWAFSLASRVLGSLKDEYVARGKSPLFDALLQSLDHPAETNRTAECQILGMTPNAFAVAFMRFRERLAVRLREEVAATVIGDNPHDIDAELRHLVTILSRHGGLAAAC
ncbi:MAG: sigma factor [Verrucomicrobiota bacterium]